MPHVQGYVSPNKPLSVRLESQERKQELLDQAKAQGSNASVVVNDLVAWWLGVPGAQLPPGPWGERSN